VLGLSRSAYRICAHMFPPYISICAHLFPPSLTHPLLPRVRAVSQTVKLTSPRASKDSDPSPSPVVSS